MKNNQIIFYATPEGNVKVEVVFEGEKLPIQNLYGRFIYLVMKCSRIKDEHLDTYTMMDFKDDHRTLLTGTFWPQPTLKNLQSFQKMKNFNFTKIPSRLFGRSRI